MAAASYQQQYYHDHDHHHHHHHPLKILNRDDSCFMRVKPQTMAKRKSAVELLQETKPLYVKSEVVLDRKQELRRSLRGYQLPNNEEFLNSCSSTLLNGLINSTSPPPTSEASQNHSSANGGTTSTFPVSKNPRLILPPPAFRKSTGSLQLQNKLRKLLNADSKENLLEINSVITNDDKLPSVKQSDRFIYCNLESEFEGVNCTKQIKLSCYKSLPDLTNVPDLSSKSEEHSELGSCGGYARGSSSSDGICKKSSYTNCTSLYSCKNDCLYASTIHSDKGNNQKRENFEDEINNTNVRGNSLPASPVKSCTSYITPPPLYCDTNELLKNRPVFRSKSDVGARNLSSVQLVDIPLYDSSNLNMFFDNLGLKSNEYSSLTAARSDASSPVYFGSSDSSVDSVGGYASGNENSPINYVTESLSIVERNARIIKWLCNCRKALEQIPRIATPQSR